MSDFTHARICIRHVGGSVEIQAPAGEVTWLDLSGSRAPAASGPPHKARLAVAVLAGCAAGVAMTLLVANRPVALASDAFPDRFAGPPSAPFAMPAAPLQQPPASTGTGSGTSTGTGTGTGTDPFGLRSR